MAGTDAAPRGIDDVLAVDRVRIAYGGNVAVEEATFTAPLGRITGLIGPNGAGKTSIFNACNGLVAPQSGDVRLFGRTITRSSPQARARLGMGRTFQTIELCNNMTVRENIALGAEARLAGASLRRQLTLGATRRGLVRQATDAAIALTGMGRLLDHPTPTLSTGQRRLLELARVLAGDYRLLLLDEPSSGLDETETERFGSILRQVVAERGLGILLVEHDMALVMSVCDHIVVLDFGQIIFEGTPAEIAASQRVQAAYLGDQAGLGAAAP